MVRGSTGVRQEPNNVETSMPSYCLPSPVNSGNNGTHGWNQEKNCLLGNKEQETEASRGTPVNLWKHKTSICPLPFYWPLTVQVKPQYCLALLPSFTVHVSSSSGGRSPPQHSSGAQGLLTAVRLRVLSQLWLPFQCWVLEVLRSTHGRSRPAPGKMGWGRSRAQTT